MKQNWWLTIRSFITNVVALKKPKKKEQFLSKEDKAFKENQKKEEKMKKAMMAKAAGHGPIVSGGIKHSSKKHH